MQAANQNREAIAIGSRRFLHCLWKSHGAVFQAQIKAESTETTKNLLISQSPQLEKKNYKQ